MTDPVTFTIGLTQWAKDLGLQGWTLKVTGVLIGGIASYLSLFYPDLWKTIAELSTGFTATGGVSFVGSMLQKMKRPTN